MNIDDDLSKLSYAELTNRCLFLMRRCEQLESLRRSAMATAGELDRELERMQRETAALKGEEST